MTNKQAAGGLRQWLSLPFRLLTWLFRGRNRDKDLEKKLQYLSKEEVTVHSRMKRRTTNWRKLARMIIIYSVALEGVILSYAIFLTRSLTLDWRDRAIRVLPVFVFPALVFLVYAGCARFTRMREKADKGALDNLRSQRRQKIEELKEKSNFYAMQQLIQLYDTDRDAQTAAAQVLLARLGAESSEVAQPGIDNTPPGGNADVAQTLRSRGSRSAPRPAEDRSRAPEVQLPGGGGRRTSVQGQAAGASRTGVGGGSEGMGGRLGDAYDGSGAGMSERRGAEGAGVGGWAGDKGGGGGGGWVGRLAAVLVGEDPTQCYALICKNCRKHNGLAKKEDLPYVTYFCPQCNFLNASEHYQGTPQSIPSFAESTGEDGGDPISSIIQREVETPKNGVCVEDEKEGLPTASMEAIVGDAEGEKE